MAASRKASEEKPKKKRGKAKKPAPPASSKTKPRKKPAPAKKAAGKPAKKASAKKRPSESGGRSKRQPKVVSSRKPATKKKASAKKPTKAATVKRPRTPKTKRKTSAGRKQKKVVRKVVKPTKRQLSSASSRKPPKKPAPKKKLAPKKKAVPKRLRQKRPERERPKKGRKKKDREKKPHAKFTRTRRKLGEAGSVIKHAQDSVLQNSEEEAYRKLEVIIELGKQVAKQQKTENKDRQRRLDAWLKDRERILPSRQAVAYFEDQGRWKQFEDKTMGGDVRYPVPIYAQRRYDAFHEWMVEWEYAIDWAKEEPFWFSVAFQVGGVHTTKERDRYERIRGRTAVTSYWVKGHSLAQNSAGLGTALLNMRETVARNLIFAKRSIVAMLLFVHYGPQAPVY